MRDAPGDTSKTSYVHQQDISPETGAYIASKNGCQAGQALIAMGDIFLDTHEAGISKVPHWPGSE
jgi:hypothetical protein